MNEYAIEPLDDPHEEKPLKLAELICPIVQPIEVAQEHKSAESPDYQVVIDSVEKTDDDPSNYWRNLKLQNDKLYL